MNQNWCDKKDYRIFILGIIFVSFGITVPIGIILLISKKILNAHPMTWIK